MTDSASPDTREQPSSAKATEDRPFDEWLTEAQRRSGYLGWYEKQGAELHGEQADLWRALREICRLQAENERLRARVAELEEDRRQSICDAKAAASEREARGDY